MKGLAVRLMLPSETTMVLSNWKDELNERRDDREAGPGRGWCRGLNDRDFWCLANHVVDRITLPSCEVYVGCHESDPETPMCWVAVRKIPSLLLHEIVWLYARKYVQKDLELAAGLERALLSEVQKVRPLAIERRAYNPFLELRR